MVCQLLVLDLVTNDWHPIISYSWMQTNDYWQSFKKFNEAVII